MPASFLPLDLMLKRSISIPLQVQFGLVSRQLLTHFFQSSPVSLWTYLETIRRFLLLQDSEFAHGLCFGLLENEARAGLQKQPQTILSPSSKLVRLVKCKEMSKSNVKEQVSYLDQAISTLIFHFSLPLPSTFLLD